ncbi:hypothetical protein D9611_010760 [Ephemerocybe angulata]|uniref:Uncharacterized protein n=1 Tax=Ephemerocybe angulata TaxID=980116 RepID=A0A8H5BE38_9AGAR|nr:hypothetical protein D9611_010760 [Tulosesus angulatus]
MSVCPSFESKERRPKSRRHFTKYGTSSHDIQMRPNPSGLAPPSLLLGSPRSPPSTHARSHRRQGFDKGGHPPLHQSESIRALPRKVDELERRLDLLCAAPTSTAHAPSLSNNSVVHNHHYYSGSSVHNHQAATSFDRYQDQRFAYSADRRRKVTTNYLRARRAVNVSFGDNHGHLDQGVDTGQPCRGAGRSRDIAPALSGSLGSSWSTTTGESISTEGDWIERAPRNDEPQLPSSLNTPHLRQSRPSGHGPRQVRLTKSSSGQLVTPLNPFISEKDLARTQKFTLQDVEECMNDESWEDVQAVQEPNLVLGTTPDVSQRLSNSFIISPGEGLESSWASDRAYRDIEGYFEGLSVSAPLYVAPPGEAGSKAPKVGKKRGVKRLIRKWLGYRVK